MRQFQHLIAAAMIMVLLLPVGAGLPEGDFEPGAPDGAATMVAEVSGGLDAFFDRFLSAFSVVSSDVPSSVEQGDTIDLTVKDTVDESCDDSVFVVEAYAPEPPSDRRAEIRALDHLVEYDPVISDQLVTADVSLTLPADAEPGEWTIVAYTYCYTKNTKLDDGGDIVYETFTVEQPDTSSGGNDVDGTDEPHLLLTEQPSVSVNDGTGEVTTSFAFLNDGGDMTEAWSVEMQVRPHGDSLLSIADVDENEELCDPNHPENVHKDFFLTAGQDIDIDLSTFVQMDKRYDVWLVTGTDCANEGGEPTGPYPQGTLVDTVCVGDCGGSGPGDNTGDGSGSGDGGDGTGQSPLVLLVAGLLAGGLILYGVRKIR